MKIIELRQKTFSELKDRIIHLKRESLNLNFQRTQGNLKNSAAFRKSRREIARIKTILRQI